MGMVREEQVTPFTDSDPDGLVKRDDTVVVVRGCCSEERENSRPIGLEF
jgi:hypothetical protein